MKSDLVDVNVIVERDNPNDKAIPVRTDRDTKVWLPRSEIEIDYPHNDRHAVVTMPEWMAMDKELI